MKCETRIKENVIILPRPSYIGQWNGISPVSVEVGHFDTSARVRPVERDGLEVQAYKLSCQDWIDWNWKEKIVFAYRSNKDMTFVLERNGRIAIEYIIPANTLWCSRNGIDSVREETHHFALLEPTSMPRQGMLDSLGRW